MTKQKKQTGLNLLGGLMAALSNYVPGSEDLRPPVPRRIGLVPYIVITKDREGTEFRTSFLSRPSQAVKKGHALAHRYDLGRISLIAPRADLD